MRNGKKGLVVVDVQNDFCPGGALGVPDGDEIVPVLNGYLQRFAEKGLPVFATRDWHPPETKHFKSSGGPWPPHCIQGTPGAEFYPGLQLPQGTVVLSKGTDPNEDAYSAFQARSEDGTSFAEVMRRHGVGHLYVGGLATDYCVRFTVADALKAGFRITVLLDAVRGINAKPGDIERALAEMAREGADFTTLNHLDLA
ncbi:MAG: bifunctional nicotinamidase/pyrazinamidase [Chloroflexota bacterium]